MDLVTRSTLLSLQTIDDIVVGHLPVIPAPLPADPANAALVLKGVKDVATPDLLSLREELASARRSYEQALQIVRGMRDGAAAQQAEAQFNAAIGDYAARCRAGRTRERELGRLIADVDVQIGAQQGAALAAAAAAVAPPDDIDLERLPLPIFRGGRKQYSTWRNLFDSSVGASRKTAVQKMAHLLCKLEGEPAMLVSGLPISNANYVVALDLLESRYRNNDLLGEELRDQLEHLPVARNSQEASEMIIRAESLMSQIEGLGEVLATRETILLLRKRLPLKHNERLLHQRRLQQGGVWTLPAFRNALRLLVQDDDEMGGLVNRMSGLRAGKASKLKVPKREPAVKTQGRPAMGLISVSEERKCVFCSGNHLNKECMNYRTAKARSSRIAELRLCFKCLKSGHGSTTCTWRNCFLCGRAHNTLLCFQSNKPQSNEQAFKFQPFKQQHGKHEKKENPTVCAVANREPSGLTVMPTKSSAFNFLFPDDETNTVEREITEPNRLALSANRQEEQNDMILPATRSRTLMMSVTATVFSADKKKSAEVLIFIDTRLLRNLCFFEAGKTIRPDASDFGRT